MEEIKCVQTGQLKGKKYNEMTGRVYGVNGISPALRTFSGGGSEVKIQVYDGYNQAIRKDSDTTGTLTCNCGADLKRNGQGIIENNRFFEQAIETASEKDCNNGDIINAYNKTVDRSGISPTLTTRPEGFKTAILPIENYRIRKLTPKECFRLMGFSDDDFEKAKKVNSNSQLYKQAGNSIVVNVLTAIFGQMLDK